MRDKIDIRDYLSETNEKLASNFIEEIGKLSDDLAENTSIDFLPLLILIGMTLRILEDFCTHINLQIEIPGSATKLSELVELLKKGVKYMGEIKEVLMVLVKMDQEKINERKHEG